MADQPLLFLASVAFLVYTLAGYPLLAAWMSRRGRPVTRRFVPRTVSVILPVHNGGDWIEAKLESLYGQDCSELLAEVIVISDGSTDSTETVATRWAGRGVRLLAIPRSGKAVAINAGLAAAQGEILLFTDVRQPLDSGALRSLLSSLGDEAVGVASGELIIRRGATREEADIGLYWRYEKWIRQKLSAIDSVMGATGALYAMRREFARPLPPDTLLDDMHLPMYAFFSGRRIVFDAGARVFDEPNSLQTEFRRKVRTLAGNYQLMARFPRLLAPWSNRMWIHFVSHKLARLILPFALLAVAVSSFMLADPFRSAALLAQTGFYGLALADTVLPQSFPLKRVTSPARTFAVLMAAAFCAVAILFVPASRFWTASGGRPPTSTRNRASTGSGFTR